VDHAKRKGQSASQYDFHSLSWLHYEYLQQGRFAKARSLFAHAERALASSQSLVASDLSRTPPATPGSMPGGRNPAEAGRHDESHQHVESEIGKGYGPMSLKSELGSMRARQ